MGLPGERDAQRSPADIRRAAAADPAAIFAFALLWRRSAKGRTSAASSGRRECVTMSRLPQLFQGTLAGRQ
jgi:hypothetical protein